MNKTKLITKSLLHAFASFLIINSYNVTQVKYVNSFGEVLIL